MDLFSTNRSGAVLPENRFGPREWFVISLLLLGIWFWLHPYRGIIHDSMLYVAQALSYLHPEMAEHDIFLKYGAQSNYNLFDNLLAIAIENVGLNSAVIGLLLSGVSLWLLATFSVASRLVDGLPRLVFMVFLFSLTPNYGSHSLFSYGEGFLTPRLYAEALVLFAITLTLVGRHVLAMLLIIATVVVHPLVALTGAMFLAIYWLLEGVSRWQLIVAFLSLLAIFIIAGVGIAPFDGLLRSMDPQWLDVSVKRSPWIAISMWESNAFATLLFDFSLLILAIHFQKGPLRRVLQSALWVGASGVLLTYLLGDLLHNQLIIQLQLWRALWLTHWFSYLAAVLLIFGTLTTSLAGRFLLFALLTAWLAPAPLSGVFAVGAVVLHFSGWFKRLTKYPTSLQRLLRLFVIFIVLSWLQINLFKAIIIWDFLPVEFYYQYPHLLIKTFSILMPFLLFLVWCALQRQRASERVLAVLLTLIIFITGLSFWDQRTVWQQQVEQEKVDTTSLFGVAIPPDAQVYWNDGIWDIWLGLKRASYWNYRQGAASLFSRELTTQLIQRMENLTMLGDVTLEYKKRAQSRSSVVSKMAITFTMLRQACLGNELLDYLVLKEAFPALALGHFNHPDQGGYYLYECAKLRKSE